MMLFQTGQLTVSTIDESDLPALFEVYRQCEGFLALGPVPVASVQMVEEDIEHSRRKNGQYCAIRDGQGRIIGVIDFIAKYEGNHTSSLLLLMIGVLWRGKGYGRAVVQALEDYLNENFGSRRMVSWVQTNNPGAIQFWERLGYHLSTVPLDQPDGTVTYEMAKVL